MELSSQWHMEPQVTCTYVQVVGNYSSWRILQLNLTPREVDFGLRVAQRCQFFRDYTRPGRDVDMVIYLSSESYARRHSGRATPGSGVPQYISARPTN